MIGAQRRVEARIGQLLPAAEVGSHHSVTTEGAMLDKHERQDFRILARAFETDAWRVVFALRSLDRSELDSELDWLALIFLSGKRAVPAWVSYVEKSGKFYATANTVEPGGPSVGTVEGNTAEEACQECCSAVSEKSAALEPLPPRYLVQPELQDFRETRIAAPKHRIEGCRRNDSIPTRGPSAWASKVRRHAAIRFRRVGTLRGPSQTCRPRIPH